MEKQITRQTQHMFDIGALKPSTYTQSLTHSRTLNDAGVTRPEAQCRSCTHPTQHIRAAAYTYATIGNKYVRYEIVCISLRYRLMVYLCCRVTLLPTHSGLLVYLDV